MKQPERYRPAYGGWCAWAMRRGTKTDIDPKSFLIYNNRLLVFYKGIWGDTRKEWLQSDQADSQRRSDLNWKKISGESPRSIPAE